jgi:hypothetical protein
MGQKTKSTDYAGKMPETLRHHHTRLSFRIVGARSARADGEEPAPLRKEVFAGKPRQTGWKRRPFDAGYLVPRISSVPSVFQDLWFCF